MIKTKFVFAVSMVAMMAVNVANAEIAATSYVDKGVTTATNAANAAQKSANAANTAAGNAQTSANNAQVAADNAQASADAAAASAEMANDAVAKKENASNKVNALTDTTDKDTAFPTVTLTETLISEANNDVMDNVNTKLASVSSSGTGSVVKAVAKDGTAVKATLGYVTTSDITDGTITNADIASNAAIAISKISGLQTALDGKQATLTIDTALSSSSTNPVQNKVVNTALAGKQATISDLSTIRSGAAAGATAVQPEDLGALATKSTIVTGDITDGTITNADIASNAAIAISKISGLQTALDGKQATLTIDTALSSSSTNPVQNKVVNTALAGKQATISDLATIRSGASAGATAVQPGTLTTELAKKENASNKVNALTDTTDKDTAFPTVTLTETLISEANNDVMDNVNTKLASVSSSGTGSVVKAVAKDGTAVKATLGYIGSSDITDGSITSADIKDATIATGDIAAGAVTAAKTTGIYGYIPSGTDKSGTAEIWVE